MFSNSRTSERLSVLATIDPVSQSVGTVTTGWISAANQARIMALLQTGAVGSSGTIDAKLQQAQDSSGTGAKDVAGKAITQITSASGSNKQKIINLAPSELDTNNGFTWVRFSITVGTAASLVGASVFGDLPKNLPASALNQSALTEIIN